MAIEIQKRLISVTDYHKMVEAGILPERGVELINGEIIEMSPTGSRHVKTVNKLNRLLGKLLGDEVIISIQNPIIAGDLSQPEPDIALLKYREDFYEKELPKGKDTLLIIEVSETSFSYDRQIKLPLYAQSAVPECWLIDLDKGEIQAFWQPAGDIYRYSQVVRKDDILNAQYFDLEIAVASIFG